jgi:hypothetical protein
MNKRIAGGVAIAAVLAGTVGGLTACSSGPSTPPNATQILQSDGYTPSAAYTQSLQGGLDGGAGTVTSSEAGTDNAGNIQAVVVFDNAADAQAGNAGLSNAGDTGFYTGITAKVSGDVLTVTGPVSAWESLGAAQ